ncbi:MAG TPA: PadR family transcriptional regulator, partial [Verrucomicrobiae bacterium]|nr:PadR family transcriptional regulator [Verrucomicrobiae bacterium]
MHPYEMRKVMRERHKDDRLVLKPGSLYNAVTWLLEEKLIEEGASSRAGRRPQRTTYHILRAGEIEL